MAKGADEVGVVGKSGHFTSLLDADSLFEQLARPEHPAVYNVFHHGKAGG